MSMLKFLPPLLMTVAGLFGFIFQNSPVHIAERKVRGFISVLYLVTVWVGFFITGLGGEYFFYSPLFTIVTSLFGLLFFGIVAYMVLNKSANISLLVMYYVFGLLSFSIAFTNYLLPQNKMILLFDIPENVEKVETSDAQGNFGKSLIIYHRYFATGVILDGELSDQQSQETPAQEMVQEFTVHLAADQLHGSPPSPIKLSVPNLQFRNLGYKGKIYVYRSSH